MRSHVLLATGLLSLLNPASPARQEPSVPVEFGRVAWGRDLAQGLRTAGELGRPVLLLFQEVPG